MSEQLEARYVAPGDVDYIDATWRLKETIRRVDGVLEQDEQFYRFQYQRCAVHLFVLDDTPVAFAIVRSDGYLSLLGVDPEFRRQGLGKRLIFRIADERDQITCHTRVDNRDAVAFYTELGFSVLGHVGAYYHDGTDAVQLELTPDDSTMDRIMDILE